MSKNIYIQNDCFIWPVQMPSRQQTGFQWTGFPQVIYDADELLRGNVDSIADDVIQMFSPEVHIHTYFV